MARLTAERRGELPSSVFAIPGKRAYPLSDEAHARNALARGAQHASSSELATIRRKVKAKYPGIAQHNDGGLAYHGDSPLAFPCGDNCPQPAAREG